MIKDRLSCLSQTASEDFLMKLSSNFDLNGHNLNEKKCSKRKKLKKAGSHLENGVKIERKLSVCEEGTKKLER